MSTTTSTTRTSPSSTGPSTTSPAASSAAEDRATAMLRTMGIREETQARALARDVLAHLGPGATPAQAVEATQAAVADFVLEVLGEPVDQVDPVWLRSFASAHPDLFLRDVAAARRAAVGFGGRGDGRSSSRFGEADQQFRLPHVPRWLVGLSVPVTATGVVVAAVAAAMSRDTLTAWELLWVVLFSFLFLLTSIGTFCAVLGAFAPRGAESPVPVHDGDLPLSAVIMPICHEDVASVHAAVEAMRASMRRCRGGDSFEFFVLSDTRDPAIAREEERLFGRFDGEGIPVYYRRRLRNDRKKVGNIAEFLERWAHRYTYAVMLDADSLASGSTIIEMVRRMHANPKLALLQAPIQVHRAETVFARAHQFATSLMGGLVTRGLALWSGPNANFYGHNAVVRVDAFLECCALPELKGEPPFGGYIMSHDFVEAALLCRAGWEVRIAHDLEATWEEMPRTLREYVARDRRWCQGNLQHLRILVAEGLRAMSRIHMLVGVSNYLAGPVWLAFLGIGVAVAQQSQGVPESGAVTLLLVATAANLLVPRALALTVGLAVADRRQAHGGGLMMAASTAVELLLSTLLAPLMLFQHSRMVFSVLAGRSSGWGSQRRTGSQPLPFGAGEVQATVLGVVVCAVLTTYAPSLLWWLAPLWGPLLLAVPVALAVSSTSVGQALQRSGLLTVPSEVGTLPVVAHADALRELSTAGDVDEFRDTVLDPVLLSMHLAYLGNRGVKPETLPAAREELDALVGRVLRGGPGAVSDQERARLEADATSMRRLHLEAWRCWPVEAWGFDVRGTSVPPELGQPAEAPSTVIDIRDGVRVA